MISHSDFSVLATDRVSSKTSSSSVGTKVAWELTDILEVGYYYHNIVETLRVRSYFLK